MSMETYLLLFYTHAINHQPTINNNWHQLSHQLNLLQDNDTLILMITYTVYLKLSTYSINTTINRRPMVLMFSQKISSHLLQFLFQWTTMILRTKMIAAVRHCLTFSILNDPSFWIIVHTTMFDYLMNTLIILQMSNVRPL